MEISFTTLFPVPKEYGIYFAAQYRESDLTLEDQTKETSPEERSKLIEAFKGKCFITLSGVYFSH